MKHIARRAVIGLLIAALLIGGGLVGTSYLRPAHAQSLGDILTIGGIVLAVSVFGDQINNFINNTLGQQEAAAVGATKVVPIIEAGSGLYVGAAQVIGTPSTVRVTQAVAAVNITLGNLTGSALVPISTRIPGRNLDRVSGVGVNAVIDFHI